jgi:hypothetical protein
MAKKRAERIRRRVTCELLLEGRSYRGIVLDLSETGVFVQTEATPQPGARLVLRFHAPGGVEIEVAASVARRKVAPRELAGVVRGGLGLRVEKPPAAYFELIGSDDPVASAASAGAAGPRAGLGAGSRVAAPLASARRDAAASARAPAPAPAPPAVDTRPEFRVRAKQCEGPRSRTMKVRAASSDEARRSAMRELGAGWEILSVDAA